MTVVILMVILREERSQFFTIDSYGVYLSRFSINVIEIELLYVGKNKYVEYDLNILWYNQR